MKRNANILIVDDTPANLRLLMNLLHEQGYKVRPAPSGKHALDVVQDAAIDLILLDILMPEMDGYEVCGRLKAQDSTRDIPVIFLSALNETFNKMKAFDMGGVDYVTKPFEAKEVLARVKTHLTIRALQQELEARNRELAGLVNIDGLTRIANRRHFDERLQHEWKRLGRGCRELALIFLDIDFFKLYNDTYGHQAGDECLKHVSHALQQVTRRPADLAARYGGEEFVILLPCTDEAGAQQVADNIRSALRQLQLPHARSTVSRYVTCSMGIACVIPTPTGTAEKFIRVADNALYQAKTQGRDRYIVESVTGAE